MVLNPRQLTDEERKRIIALGEIRLAKGCKCRNRCWHAFNKWWDEKAQICTHPNWAPPDPPKGK